MATGSQNMTTYIAKQVIGDITNADWSGALLHSGKDGKSNSIDTWIFADDYGSASSNYGIKHNQTEDTIEFVGASTARTTIHLGKSEIVVSHLVGGADTWYTARTFTIGNTGKSVNGNADVSWSKDEILGGSGTTTFLRADKSWTNILTGPFYSTGSPGFQNVTSAGTWAYLQLKSGTLGWDIASNSSQNSGALDFRPHKSTNHGIMISQDGGLYFRNPATEGIYYQGTKANYRMIRFLDNSSSTDGNGIIIGGAGYVGIGSGESGDQSYTGGGYTAGSETLVLSSDGDIRLLPTQQDGYNVAYETLITTSGLWVGKDGNTTREMDIVVRSGAGTISLWSAAAVAGDRGLWLTAHGSGGGYAIVCADTNNVSYLQGHRIGIKNTDATSGYGLSLYNGQYNGVPEYGMFFGGTGTFGKFGDVSADWATYFTMNRNDTRGWIFKSNGTTKNGSYNVASISGRGHFTGTLSPSSWIDGQRYMSAAYNIADYSNTGSYNPWMRATNTWTSGAENAKVGRWFSFGTLGNRFYWIGSTTTRTANSYDHGMSFDISNGVLYAAFSGDLTGNVTGNCSGSSGSCTGNAATATNADKVDNYHASDLWRKDGGTWNGNANIACTPTANNQEYSFDLGNAHTGTYWHVWSGKNSKSILVCYNDSMNVSVPNGTLTANAFSGPLTGNVTGNCSGSSGSCTGNSATTSKLSDSAHSWTATEVYNYMTARVLKAGDTMSGNLFITTDSGDHYFEVKSNATGVRLELDNSGSTNHGVWSSGYWNGSAYKASSLWMIYRNASGTVVVNGDCTGSAGSVAWANVSSKPATATRWPSWSEVTSKPAVQNNLTSTSTTDMLSAAQGKALNDNKTAKGTGLAYTTLLSQTYSGTSLKSISVSNISSYNALFFACYYWSWWRGSILIPISEFKSHGVTVFFMIGGQTPEYANFKYVSDTSIQISTDYGHELVFKVWGVKTP